MIRHLLLFVFVLIMNISAFSQTQPPPLETGVSQALAKWRAANYSDVRYKLNITLEKGAPLMKGDIEIRVNLTEEGAKNNLILDWRTTAFENDNYKPFAYVLQVNESAIEQLPGMISFTHSIYKEHILIAQKLLKTGENVIKIEFASPIKTSGAAITRYVDKEDGAEYVYSLFVPSDASTAFPVFDQPDLKARFKLTVIAPDTWKVISNGDLIEYVGMFSSEEAKKQTKIEKLPNEQTLETVKTDSGMTVFRETSPISCYVFAFAVGDFSRFDDEKSETYKGGTIRKSSVYVRKSQAEKFKQHSEEVFRLNREGVKYLESYFDFKFPFPKYDLVLIPEFPFGGMEHAGATFLRESSVIFPSEPTANDYISRANVIFHEAAHQWFGDTVTMKWFDDLWLKEGFAEFMAYKTLEKVMPQYNAWKAFYERNKPLAYLTDSTKGTTPIYQEIPNLSAAKSAYGNIVYRKAPSFLRQAEFFLGEDKFQTAVRAFLKNHQYSNAEWTDLVKEFEDVAWKNNYKLPEGTQISKEEEKYLREDIRKSLEKWVKQLGMPLVKDTSSIFLLWEPVNASNRTLKVGYFEGRKSHKSILGEDNQWTEKFKLLGVFPSGDRKEVEVTFFYDEGWYDGRFPHFVFSKGSQTNEKPLFVFPNYQDYGYGIFLLDEKSRAYVLANIQNEKDDFLRSMMWGTLWDSVREAELAPRDYVQLAVRNISVEQDELTIQTILSRVSTAMNYYLSDAERNELAPQLEKLLIDKIQNAPTAGQRITYYRAFLNTASTENARAVLKQIYNEDLGIGGGNTKMRPGVVTDKAGNKIYAASPVIQLKQKDRFDIVTRLLILGDREAPQMLADLEKSQTGDDARRYAYAAKAGIATAENKAKYFDDFLNNKEISESYIETAFVPFNSVRHNELTLPYLEKALAELPNLKRNRKIFFVNGWLGAFIGGQKSEQALAIVNKFLTDNPNLDKDLRLKILENVDGLERAVKIRNKFH